ncbi:MAG: hypothetical protein JRI72_14065 [Deltaproteobacteria bacterium]|nr:hypothetical protein [Deltaproteobacteria bacterium]
MELTVNLAGTNVTISLLDQAKKAAPWCSHLFRGFVQPGKSGGPQIDVCILKSSNNRSPIREKAGSPIFERLLPTDDVAAWLREVPGYTEDFPISEKTISSFCLGGLLLYNPDTAAGRMYLLNQGPRRFQPLYRLLWMYFAQVLGEREGCFVHAAALVKDEEGYLFMGDSGAGKSTLAKHCTGCHVLSDDGPIFLRQNGEYRVYPSPYHQIDPVKGLDKEVIQMSAWVKGLYFLIKDDRLFLERVSKKEAFSMILKRYIHFFPYLSTQAKSALFDLLFEACYKLPTFYFHFRLDEDIWKVIIGK